MNAKPSHAALLLCWYDRHQRAMPWRYPNPDPYHVWVSEVMLQQTTVETVKEYYTVFIKKYPNIKALSQATLDDVLFLWQGLGYYSRARNLHRCAHILMHNYKGIFPEQKSELLKLPGIGDYTASAIAAIAFQKPETVIDGNVVRVIARLFSLATASPALGKEVAFHAAKLTPKERVGDYAQAMMDLGASLCKPRIAHCSSCPLSPHCQGRYHALSFPKKTKRQKKTVRRALIFFLEDSQGRLLCGKRPEKGLLGGTVEFPSSVWLSQKMPSIQSPPDGDIEGWHKIDDGNIIHVFTHFRLEMEVFTKKIYPQAIQEGFWLSHEEIKTVALSTLMHKALAKFLLWKTV